MSKSNILNMNINFRILLYIISASLALGFIYNYFSSDGIPIIRKPIVVNEVDLSNNEEKTDGINSLDLANTINIFNQGKAIFIDARDQWEYSEGHIKGAINIPEFSFEPSNKELEKISKASLIVVYCDGDDCETSKRLTSELVDLGYVNSFLFLGGYNEWVKADLPIEVESENE